jgi:hypothetical protein
MENKEEYNLASTTNNFTLPYSHKQRAGSATNLFRQGVVLEKIKKSIKNMRHYSNSVDKRNISITDKPSINKLNPFWVTGFSDAESTFSVSIIKSTNSKLG